MLVLEYARKALRVGTVLLCGACNALAGQSNKVVPIQSARGHCVWECKLKYFANQDPAHPSSAYWHCLNRCIATFPLPNRNDNLKPLGN